MVFITKSDKLLWKIIDRLPKQPLQNLRLHVEHPVCTGCSVHPILL